MRRNNNIISEIPLRKVNERKDYYWRSHYKAKTIY